MATLKTGPERPRRQPQPPVRYTYDRQRDLALQKSANQDRLRSLHGRRSHGHSPIPPRQRRIVTQVVDTARRPSQSERPPEATLEKINVPKPPSATLEDRIPDPRIPHMRSVFTFFITPSASHTTVSIRFILVTHVPYVSHFATLISAAGTDTS